MSTLTMSGLLSACFYHGMLFFGIWVCAQFAEWRFIAVLFGFTYLIFSYALVSGVMMGSWYKTKCVRMIGSKRMGATAVAGLILWWAAIRLWHAGNMPLAIGSVTAQFLLMWWLQSAMYKEAAGVSPESLRAVPCITGGIGVFAVVMVVMNHGIRPAVPLILASAVLAYVAFAPTEEADVEASPSLNISSGNLMVQIAIVGIVFPITARVIHFLIGFPIALVASLFQAQIGRHAEVVANTINVLAAFPAIFVAVSICKKAWPRKTSVQSGNGLA